MKILEAILNFITGFTLNEDITHSLKECKGLFGQANKSIHIVAGDLESTLFEDKEVLDILKQRMNRQKNPIDVQIIYGPKHDPKTHTIFEWESPNLLMAQVPTRPSAHFMIIDNKHTRVEEYHEQFKPERKAYIAYRTLFLADKLETEFAKLKSQAITIENVKKATA